MEAKKSSWRTIINHQTLKAIETPTIEDISKSDDNIAASIMKKAGW
jgi:hypothetical protein